MRRNNPFITRLVRKPKINLVSANSIAKNKTKVKKIEPLTEILTAFTSVLNKPTLFITLLISFVVVLSHADDLSTGPLKDLSDAYPNNPFVKFLIKAGVRTLGFVIFIPTLVEAPKNLKIWLMLSVALWVYFTESRTTYSYLIEALCMFAFLKVKNTQAKLIIVGVAIAVILTSGVTFFKKPASQNSPPADPSRRAGRQVLDEETLALQINAKDEEIKNLYNRINNLETDLRTSLHQVQLDASEKSQLTESIKIERNKVVALRSELQRLKSSQKPASGG